MSHFFTKAKYIFIGMIMNLCLGAVYAWSIFRNPVEKLFQGTDSFESGLPYMFFLFSYAFSMPLGGKLIDKLGPRVSAIIGAFIVSIGWFLAGFSENIYHLMITYGVLGGIGVGIIYGVPMSVAGKWFPQRKGLAVGITLAGFGISPFVTAPLSKYLITKYDVLTSFKILGILFFVILTIFSLFMIYPKDENNSAESYHTDEITWQNMLKKPLFYILWITFMFGTFTGLMVIGISSPFAEEYLKINSNTAAIFVSIFAIFNGLGRPVYGYLTDHLGTRISASIIFFINTFASILLISSQYLSETSKFIIYIISISIFWASFGGWLAVAPATTAKFFGKKNYVKNYGFVFTAYGIGAILGGIISGEFKIIFGSYLYIFYPVTIISLLGLILSLIFLKKSK